MFDSELQNEIIEKLKAASPEKVILFGSYAYGNPSEDSDIDLFVIKTMDADKIRNYRLGLKKLLWQSFSGRRIFFDVKVDSESRIRERINMGDLFYREIMEKGKVLYA